MLNKNPSSDPSSDGEDSDDSDPPVFRGPRSDLPNIKPTLVVKTDNTAPKSVPPRLPDPSPWLAPLLDTYVDVYVEGAWSYNGRGGPRAGIGVWFGPNHLLNISRLSQGRQTNNSAEIAAATVAAQLAHEAGIKKLRTKTDSKFLVNSTTEWIPRWEANDCKTYENKPVRNRSQFERIKTALEPLDVIWEHVPSHKGIPGNKMADKLAREGIEAPPFTENKAKVSPPEQMILDILPQPPGSEGSDETNEDTVKQHQPKNKLREDLQKSFSKLDKSIENRGLESSNIVHESRWRDHEDIQNDCRLYAPMSPEGKKTKNFWKT